MKKYLLFILVFLTTTLLFGQSETGFFGKIIDSKTHQPLENIIVWLEEPTTEQITAKDGLFKFTSINEGKTLFYIKGQNYKERLFSVTIIQNKLIDLGIIVIEEEEFSEEQGAIITLSDNDYNDDTNESESSPALLQSGKDALQQAAAFNWGQTRFSIRGLDSQHATTMINGITMNKQYDGRPQWSEWGGLNDVLRNQEFTLGSVASDYTFGGILGTQEISTRASFYRPGTRISFSGANTNYNSRFMASYCSGLSNNGWAMAFSLGKRWAQEGYFQGTNYDADSFFASVEKKINESHSLNLTMFYTPSQRGKNSANTDEVSQLTSHKYNSFWGWQQNIKRNSRTKNTEEPVCMLNHYFKINNNSRLYSGIVYQFGKIGNSNLDYQNTNSPDPTYYRKLPSFYISAYTPDKGEYSGIPQPDYQNAEKNRIEFLNNSQIEWDAIYKQNQQPVLNLNGNVVRYEPGKSNIVLYEDQTKDFRLGATSMFNTVFNDNLIINAGLNFNTLRSKNYQKLLDLLGGAYFNDIDSFYKGKQAQSDLKNPDRQVKEGDVYGYNYEILSNSLDFFTQFRFQYKKVDFYISQKLSVVDFQRDGKYQNGIYENNSFGKSDKITFEDFGLKGGVVYKIRGNQHLTLNGSYTGKAPAIKNIFSNVRLNNSVVDDIKSEKISSLDINYYYRTQKIKARTTLFFSSIKNSTQISFFYAEGVFNNNAGFSSSDAFLSQTVTGLDKLNLGLELSLDYQLNSEIRIYFVESLGRYTFNSNPRVTLANDLDASPKKPNPVYDFGRAYLKNYYQAGTPQQACSIGAEYRSPKYWWISANFNYLSGRYIDISIINRTDQFYINPVTERFFPEATQERARELLAQETLPAISLTNISGGKSWRIFNKNLGVFISINNIFNKIFQTGGFEQSRKANYRELDHDVSSQTSSFGNKYYYGYGRSYFVNLYINI